MKLKLHWQILVALILAVIAGTLSGKDATILDVSLIDIFNFIGTLFFNALKMLIVPLIVSSIVVGVSTAGASDALRRLSGKTIIYYMSTSLIAILIGLAMVDIVQPGIVDGQPARELIGLSADVSALQAQIEGKGMGDVVAVFLRIVPTNIVESAVKGEMLGLIFFSMLFGFFMTRIAQPNAETLRNFWQGVFEVMMLITRLVMKFAPIGVFALVAKVVATTGFSAFAPLAWFVFTVMIGLALHMFVILPLIVFLVCGRNPWLLFRAMTPALLTAFSTASSSATLPLTLECVEKNAGVSNRTCSFVVPLGATLNMDGTALYECAAAIFIAQAYGLDLSVGQQFMIVLTALITSMGVAGIPAASLVAISIILTAMGLPLEGVGLILAVDRILDMCRTSVNVFSDSCGAVVVARLEGEEQVLASDK